jgi:predicted metalloprotease with PDZ domain
MQSALMMCIVRLRAVGFRCGGCNVGDRVSAFLLCSLLFWLLGSDATAQVGYLRYPGPKIAYEVAVDEERWDGVWVSVLAEDLPDSAVTLVLPRWSPGAYVVRDYGDNVEDLRAYDVFGNEIPVVRLDRQRWRVSPLPSGYLRATYRVRYPMRFGRRNIDSTHALIEGPMTYVYLDGYRQQPISVSFDFPTTWKISTGLKVVRSGGYDYWAENYDVLVDTPVELGDFEEFHFSLGDVRFDVVVDGPIEFNVDRFLLVLRKISEYQARLFGGLPFDRYLFIYHIRPGPMGGGGLEHLNSTTITLSGEQMAIDPANAAEVTAHELFHAWNVKRIRPKVLGPFDYLFGPRTKALWFSEGVTSYYAALTLVRTGIWTQERFLTHLTKQIEKLQSNPDRLRTSVEEASWHIWERGYRHPGISFYNKGELLGLLLDLKIRAVTGNRHSLDDVMRLLNWWFARRDEGFADSDLERAVSAVAETDFSEFFERYVAGTVELPYDEAFAAAGYQVSIDSAWVPTIGEVVFVGRNRRVVRVEEGSPADNAGLRRGDRLISLAGQEIRSYAHFDSTVATLTFGSEVPLKVRRQNVDLELIVRVGRKPKVSAAIRPVAEATAKQLALRRSWLTGK